MTAIGIVGIAVGAIIFVRGILFIRSAKQNIESMIVWLLVGLCIIVISADPTIITPYITIFGFQYESSLIAILGVLFLTLVVFWLYNMVLDLRDKVKILHDNLAIILSNSPEARQEDKPKDLSMTQ